MTLLDSLFKKRSKFNPLEMIPYKHSDKFSRYMADPVAHEKRIILYRAMDKLNIGHTTREDEIKSMIYDEFRFAAHQRDDHLAAYEEQFADTVKKLSVNLFERDTLAKDLANINMSIQYIESELDKGGEKNE